MVFDCLKKYGQMLDTELSARTGLALFDVHVALATLAEQREIARCQVIRYIDGIAVTGVQCRLVGQSTAFGIWYGYTDRPLFGQRVADLSPSL